MQGDVGDETTYLHPHYFISNKCFDSVKQSCDSYNLENPTVNKSCGIYVFYLAGSFSMYNSYLIKINEYKEMHFLKVGHKE